MLSGREGASAEMIGRSSALDRLCGLVEAAEIASCDRPEIAIVTGDAGMGKTRLFRELVDQVPSGTTVFTMSARPGSVGRAHDTVATTSWRHDPAVPFETLDLTSDVAGDVSRVSDAGDQGDAVFAIASAAVERGPIVVIVEDVHWIDAASALAVDRIAQQPWPRSAFMFSYRPDDLTPGSPGGELIARLERRHDVEQVRLGPLDRSEVGALVAAIRGTPASSAVVEALHRRSGGVPYVVEELLRFCGPDSVADDVLTAALPWSLDEAVRQQIAALAPVERTLLDTLAVLGRPASFDVLAEVARRDEDDAVAGLRGLVGGGVVVESGDDVFWFAHALMADAVEAQLLGRERRRLHERCAEVLGRDPDADPAALARHAIGAGRFDAVAAIARAGAPRYLAQGSTFQALRLASQGLAEDPDDPLLLGVATDAAWRLGFMEESACHARRWVAVATDAHDRAEALRFVGRLGRDIGDPDAFAWAAERLIALVDECVEAADARCEGRALAALAQVQMLGPRPADAIDTAERALAVAATLDGPEAASIRARALVESASAAVRAGRPRPETTEALERAAAEARQVGDPVLLARALNNLIDQHPPRSERAAELRAELAAVSRSGGVDLLMFGGVHWWEAEAAWSRGDLAAYRRSVNDARQWWRVQGDAVLIAVADALIAHEEGRHDDVRRALDAVASLERESPVQVLRVIVSLTEQRRDAASPPSVPPLDGALLHDTPHVLESVLGMVAATLGAGIDPDDVRRDVLDRWVGDHPAATDVRRTVEGLLLAASGDHRGAVEALRAVIDDPDPTLPVFWLGTLRTELAASLLALGERDEARAEVRHALDHELARWPGVRRDRATQLARRLEGAGPRSAEGELTPREREVAALLVQGITNAQLAERLFISPKTAAVHVSNILAKLGLASRAEIAAWAVRSGLDRESA